MWPRTFICWSPVCRQRHKSLPYRHPPIVVWSCAVHGHAERLGGCLRAAELASACGPRRLVLKVLSLWGGILYGRRAQPVPSIWPASERGCAGCPVAQHRYCPPPTPPPPLTHPPTQTHTHTLTFAFPCMRAIPRTHLAHLPPFLPVRLRLPSLCSHT